MGFGVTEQHAALDALAASEHPGVRGQAATTAAAALILLDIHLPDSDGYALLSRLRAEPGTQATPVVALTADAMRDDEQRMRDAGFADSIAKPIDVAALDALIDRVAARRVPA